jgi:hypothetical protein
LITGRPSAATSARPGEGEPGLWRYPALGDRKPHHRAEVELRSLQGAGPTDRRTTGCPLLRGRRRS